MILKSIIESLRLGKASRIEPNWLTQHHLCSPLNQVPKCLSGFTHSWTWPFKSCFTIDEVSFQKLLLGDFLQENDSKIIFNHVSRT